MIAIILMFININSTNVFFGFLQNHGTMSGVELGINILTSVMLSVSVIATIFSGYDYIKGGKDLFKDR